MSVQELVCSADEDREAVLAYRNALEQALDAPAAAHPVEGYGPDNMSLAQVQSMNPCLHARASTNFNQAYNSDHSWAASSSSGFVLLLREASMTEALPLQARRTLSGLLRKGKEALRENDADEAILTAKQASLQIPFLLCFIVTDHSCSTAKCICHLLIHCTTC